MTHVNTTSFEELYRAHPDPWEFATSFYETRRYEITIAALPRPRFRRAFEPACANGELTRRLAERCDLVLALDCSETAVARARARCARAPGVTVRAGELPRDWPDGGFDLIVFSELGYYFDPQELAGLRRAAVGSLDPGGHLIAVHWLGESPDHLLSGDHVHRVLREGPGLAASSPTIATRASVWTCWRGTDHVAGGRGGAGAERGAPHPAMPRLPSSAPSRAAGWPPTACRWSSSPMRARMTPDPSPPGSWASAAR